MMEDRLYLVRFALWLITGLYCSSLIWQGEARRRTTVSRQTLVASVIHWNDPRMQREMV